MGAFAEGIYARFIKKGDVMYYVVNLETRSVLTYKDGSRIIEASAELATRKAESAHGYQHHPHAVVPFGQSGVDALGREVAPWFLK